MAVIRKVGVLSFAKVYGVISAVAGLFVGLLYALIGSVIGIDMTGSGIGALSIVVFPLLYGAFGFVSGAIGAFSYNLVAGKIGGIELDLDR